MATDTLHAMLEQESGAYRISTRHLGAALRWNRVGDVGDSDSEDRDSARRLECESPGPCALSPTELATYFGWRRAMIEWTYRIGQACNFSRETIEITALLVDRYVASRPNIALDAAEYQLACMACLYTAAKTSEPACLSLVQVCSMSNCRFGPDDLAKAEFDILSGLGWRVNPPTASSFAREVLDTIEGSLSFVSSKGGGKCLADVVERDAADQIELATADERFLAVPRSEIAAAAVANAIRGRIADTRLASDLASDASSSLVGRRSRPAVRIALAALVATSLGRKAIEAREDIFDDEYVDKENETPQSVRKQQQSSSSSSSPVSAMI